MQVLQRVRWTGAAVDLGQLFVLRKDEWLAICALSSHPDGWELRVYIDSPENIITTRVCEYEQEVVTTAERWKHQLGLKGWG